MPFSFDEQTKLFVSDEQEYIKMIRITGINLFGMKQDDQELRMVSLQRMFNHLVRIGQIYSYEIPADVDGYISDYEYFESQLDLTHELDYIKYDILEENKERLVNTSITRELVDRCFLLIIKDKNISRLDQRINDAYKYISSYNQAEILDYQQMAEIIYSYYNPRESVFTKTGKTISEDIMDYIYPDNIGFVDRSLNQYIKLNGIYCSILYVSKFTKINLGFLSVLATYPDVEFSLHFEQAPKNEITNVLNKSLKNTTGNLEKEKEGSKILELQDQEKKTIEFINQISVDDDIPFYFSVCIRLKSNDLDDLNAYTDDVRKELNGMGLKVRSGIWQSYELFNTCAPICMNEAPVYMKQTTNDTLGWGYPFVFETLYDSTPKYQDDVLVSHYPPLYIGNTNPTGGVVFYDNFTKLKDRANYNEFIEGKSGFGKTTLMMALIKFRHAVGYQQYILDVEGKELNRLTYELGGEIINGANGDSGIINPMQVRIVVPEDPTKSKTKIPLDQIKPLRSHIRFLRSFLRSYKGDTKDISRLHDSKIEDAEIDVYKEYGIDFDTNAQEIVSLSNDKFPIFSDVYKKLEEYKADEENKDVSDSHTIKILNDCLAFLKPISFGADADVFNGHTSINLENSLLCFDVSGLHDNTSSEILGTQYLNILSFIWSRIESSDGTQRIQVYEDEVAVIQDPKYMDIIIMNEDMTRRVRKYLCGMTFGTQQLTDMLKESIKENTKTLMQQSVYQFYFNTDPESLEYLRNHNLVPNSEIEWLQKSEIGQCFVKLGNMTSMRVNVDLGEKTLSQFKRLKGETE